MNQNTIAKNNGVEIATVTDEDGNVFVPIRPICDAIGINYSSQFEKLRDDDTLSEAVVPLKGITGADGKSYEMICIRLQYVYGWLFTINPKNVAPEARETVSRYRRECYNVLYEHFTGTLRRQIETNEAEVAALKEVNAAIADEKEAKARRKKAEEHLAKVRAARLDDTPSLFN